MPPRCTIKAKFAVRARVTGNVGIYHLQGCRSYPATTKPDRWFCTEDDAQAAGFGGHIIAGRGSSSPDRARLPARSPRSCGRRRIASQMQSAWDFPTSALVVAPHLGPRLRSIQTFAYKQQATAASA